MKARRLATILPVIVILTGCAGLTERELEERNYERANYEAEFIDYRTRCSVRGKRMWISARGTVGRDGIPSPGDHYYCG